MSFNKQFVLAQRPKTNIVPGETFKITQKPAPTEADLKDGQVLLESLYISFDPAMRGWLDDKRSYLPPVQIGEVMRALTIARVLASKSSKFAAGDIVTGTLGIQEIGILPEAQVEKAFDLPSNGKLTDLLGSLGTTGLTAYFGMTKIGMPKSGDTVVVSAAAGATGSVAAQIAKIAGARVIGIAGGEKKRKWLEEELGLDVGLDYKAADFKQKFKEATPKFIDVYFDNVGGEILDMALGRAATFSRFVMCGGISQYNAETKAGPSANFFNIISQRIKMQGFIVFDFITEYAAARKQLAQWLGEGKLKREETIIKGGVASADEAFQTLFNGGNIGKLMVEVKSSEQSPRL
ncbi:putative NADP-dependent oxidoreductase [Podospora australis]|uniref:Dehydrogenase FUB6 n=1 Tax=Podospora australis TaxID=1536484 RepID=A0AAN7AMM6_9PEZI|nr:putative NADP-dependent oxidoreductase [Podospora australis]